MAAAVVDAAAAAGRLGIELPPPDRRGAPATTPGAIRGLFSGGTLRDEALAIVAAKRRLAEAKLSELRAIEPAAREGAESDPYPYLVLRYGLEMSEWTIAWCDRARAEIEGGD